MIKKNIVKLAISIIDGLAGKKLYTESDLEAAVLNILNINPKAQDYHGAFSSDYYQNLHETNAAFQQNNWLVSELGDIRKIAPAIITELACGNAIFSKKVAPFCKKVYAIDWAESPGVKNLPANVIFLKRDIAKDTLPNADLVCSADFLEHLPPELLESTIKKIISSSPLGYHKIACYDDGHSHLSILPPWRWLQLFRNVDPRYSVKKIEFRRGDTNQAVIVLSNS